MVFQLMNLHKALQDYVTKILSVSGMKSLLLDTETVSYLPSE